MANRKLPFGYCLRNGQVREEEQEAGTVQLIFRRYGEGTSYGALADELNALGCPYAPSRPWNKNMVARILQDGRYLGSTEYPRLLSPELFHQAQSARPDVSGRLERPEVKDIRILARCAQCHGPMRRAHKDDWRCPYCVDVHSRIKDDALIKSAEHLLCILREHPEAVSPAPAAESENEAVQTAQDRLTRELEQAEFDEAAAKAQVIALASARFDALGSGDYETMRLRHLLGSTKPCDGLDSELLRQIAAAVLIHSSGAVSLKLRNGQTLENPAE